MERKSEMVGRKEQICIVLASLLCGVWHAQALTPAELAARRAGSTVSKLVDAQQQALQLQMNIPYHHLTYYAAHNAYATTADKYSLAGPNQKKSFLEQLAQYSARAVELDIWPYKENGVHLCHSECGKAGMAMLRPFHDQGEDVERYLKYIATFLDGQSRQSGDIDQLNGGKDKDGNRYFNLPQAQAFIRALRTYLETGDKSAVDATGWDPAAGMYELLRRPPIITIHFEDSVEDGSKVDKLIESSGLAPYVLKPGMSGWNEGEQRWIFQAETGDWEPVALEGWPAITSMILSGKVVVILSSKGANRPTKYMFNLWAHSWETKFSEDASANFKEINMDACKALQDRGAHWEKYLLTLHHHAYTPAARDHAAINSSLLTFLNNCFAIGGFGGTRDRYPNFILTDMVHEGNVYTDAMRVILDRYLQKLRDMIPNAGDRVVLPDDGKLHADDRFKDNKPLGQALRMHGLDRKEVKVPADF